MVKKSKAASVMLFLLLFAAVFFVTFTEAVSADDDEGVQLSKTDPAVLAAVEEDSDGTEVHQDPATFEKNYCLTPGQKEYTITKIEEIISRILKPGMSDLEKYYRLAVWENRHVKYDGKFWSGAYNFDLYRHQWDAYGTLTEKSVCVGIAVTYANLCHAADLPCKFARLKKGSVDHTINYIPDINGNAYYADITENDFIMSEETCAFGNSVDKDFSKITKTPDDGTFEYYETYDYDEFGVMESARPTDLKECYNITYDDWFTEYALHQNTEKDFRTPYVEKGSGDGTFHAAYHDYPTQYSAAETPVYAWFLEDFYRNPKELSEKILNKEFDEQLLDISGAEEKYECETLDELTTEVLNDIVVRYFPSSENNEVVPWADDLKTGIDYTLSCDTYDEANGEAVITIEGSGEYKGSSQFRVKFTPRIYIDQARILPCTYGKDFVGELVPEVVCLGETLQEDIDYTWEKVNPAESFDKAGDYEVKVTGKGKYLGEKIMTFHIVVPEEEAMQAVEDAKAELAGAQAAVDALGENATSAEISAALKTLVTAQQSLINAQDALARTRYILSRDDQIDLEEKIMKLEQQLKDETERLEEKIENLSDDLDNALMIDISCYPYVISLPKTSYTYTGKAIEPEVKVVGLSPDYYTVSYSDNINIGTATVTVTASGYRYTGSISANFEITKKANTLAVKGKTAAVKYKKLKKKAQTLNITKLINFKNKGQGNISYTKVSGNRNITINKKSGKVTVKKGLKKGTYKVKVKLKAAGDKTHKASGWKTVTFKLKVK